jgi:hypothetical protein
MSGYSKMWELPKELAITEPWFKWPFQMFSSQAHLAAVTPFFPCRRSNESFWASDCSGSSRTEACEAFPAEQSYPKVAYLQAHRPIVHNHLIYCIEMDVSDFDKCSTSWECKLGGLLYPRNRVRLHVINVFVSGISDFIALPMDVCEFAGSPGKHTWVCSGNFIYFSTCLSEASAMNHMNPPLYQVIWGSGWYSLVY